MSLQRIAYFLMLLAAPFIYAQEDCSSAITLCGNSAINYTPAGTGNQYEYLGGCLISGEHHSVWYKFTIATSGTLTFDLVPTGPVDYDWAIYGPNVNCNNRGTPIRCNASGYLVPTGMNLTNTNTTSAGGNTPPYTQYMNVVAGETYYLYIDNWSPTVYTFNLTWGGTATFVSPFNNPTLAPNPFNTPGNPGPTPSSPNEIDICGSSTLFDFSTLSSNILNGNAHFEVSYYYSANDASSGNNPITNPIMVNTGVTYFYTISYNDPTNPNSAANDCKDIGTIQFVDKSVSPTILAATTLLCPNGNIVLTSNYTTGNLWSNGATSQSITVNSAGTYALTVSNGSCSETTSITITDAPDPNLQISGNLTFCEGNFTTLTATANGTGNTFSWSNGSNGPTINVNSGGMYTVTVTTPSGCEFQESVNVVMDPKIVISIANPPQINCNNSQITINASNTVFQPGSTILWTTSGGGNIVSGATTLTPIVDAAGTYTLTITSATPNGCTAQASVTVDKNITPPTISLNSTKLSICEGDSVTLTAFGAQIYNWDNLPGTSNTQTVSPTATTTYSVSGIGFNGCPSKNTATITITVVPEITSTLVGGQICKGDSIRLDAGSGNNYTYQWSTGETTQTINIDEIGTYFVTISNGSCSETFSAVVTNIIVPEIIDLQYKNKTLSIFATSPNNQQLEYSIDGGASWQDSNMFSNVKNNIEILIAVRIKGDYCNAYQTFYTFEIPNAITPNNDGYNDKIDFTWLLNLKDSSVEIYDRYGKLVYKGSKQNPIWDGIYLTRKLPTASYWYIVRYYDEYKATPTVLNGWIMVKDRE